MAPRLKWKPLSAALVICCDSAIVSKCCQMLCGLGKVQETLACPILQTPLTQDTWQGVRGLHSLGYAPW